MTGTFKSLSRLTNLGLARNFIKSIHNKAFMGLVSLKHLDLRDNALTSIQDNPFSGMPNLVDIYIDSSSLLCDCNLKWFPLWLAREGYTQYTNAKCAHPLFLQSQPIISVPTENFTCRKFMNNSFSSG
jgi:hypothetical protein